MQTQSHDPEKIHAAGVSAVAQALRLLTKAAGTLDGLVNPLFEAGHEDDAAAVAHSSLQIKLAASAVLESE